MLFVSIAFAKKMVRHLNARRIDGFKPALLGGFEGKMTQAIDVVMVADFYVQGRLCRNLPFVVIDMKYDLIIGRKWFHDFDVDISVRKHSLAFPPAMPAIHLDCRYVQHDTEPLMMTTEALPGYAAVRKVMTKESWINMEDQRAEELTRQSSLATMSTLIKPGGNATAWQPPSVEESENFWDILQNWDDLLGCQEGNEVLLPSVEDALEVLLRKAAKIRHTKEFQRLKPLYNQRW